MRIAPKRDYLSYSQISTWRDGQGINDYINIYIKGIRLSNKYLTFGSLIGKGLECRNEKATCRSIEVARELIPVPDVPEKKIITDFHGIPMLGYLDGFIKSPIIIEEYKTSKNPWTQARVDNALQITIYVILVSTELKIKPEDIKIRLHWLESIEGLDGQLMLTGRCKVFETKRTTLDILKVYPLIKRTWVGINELYKQYE
jgi:hypothetical protein